MMKLTTLFVMTIRKSRWIFLLWVALLGSCQQKKQREYNYLIVADIEGCKDCNAKLRLTDSLPTGIDTITATSGQFSMQGKITQPGFYDLYYYSEADKTVSNFVQLYLPTDSIHIKATRNTLRPTFYRRPDVGSYLRNTVVFSSSPQQKEWEQYLVLRDSLWQKFFMDKALIRAKFIETMKSGNRDLIEQWADSVRNFDYRASGYWASAADLFIQQHPTSEVSLYAMLDNRNDRPAVERFRRYYQSMPKPLQQSFYGQILNKQLAKSEGRNQNSQHLVGRRIQHLAGKTSTGQALDAAQLFKQNKLTLIEFWASWCGPCRMEMPKYSQLYTQYHSKGFGMIGVSMDHNYNKWIQAIAEDSLRMPHLSELQGAQGEDIRRFGITGIPANLLVDSTGRIVAVDIPYPRLQKKVQQTL